MAGKMISYVTENAYMGGDAIEPVNKEGDGKILHFQQKEAMKGGSSSTEKKSFRCNSSTSSSYPRFRRCSCGEKLILLTSKSLRQKTPVITSSGLMREVQKMYPCVQILQLKT
ncbi:putative thioredoxin-like 4, chloroplastic [Sesbania bispinosa]|nr:putative thioredoxin-like 4, chloroplastic [Sesbania bispinosa]